MKRHKMTTYSKSAFTLAEVLITIGIIGVVAALTIPTLVKNYQEYAWKQAWKKQYSVIEQAYEKWKLDEGSDLASYFAVGVTSSPLASMMKYMRADDCPSSNYNVCKTSVSLSPNNVYKTLSGSYMNYNDLVYKQLVLSDGINLFSKKSTTQNNALIWADVNGFYKGPNTLGKDMYGVVVTKDKIMPMGADGSGVTSPCTKFDYCASTSGFHETSCAGAGCSAKYLYN